MEKNPKKGLNAKALDALNAFKVVEKSSSSRTRIWTNAFRQSQKNQKISSAVRNQLSRLFNDCFIAIRKQDFDGAKKAYQNLKDFANGKDEKANGIKRLESDKFDKLENYTNKSASDFTDDINSDKFDANFHSVFTGLKAIELAKEAGILTD